MKAYQADIAKFEATGTQVIGISVDTPPSNKKFAELNGLTFPLLSDTSHKVSKEYGILMDIRGLEVARRTTFVLDSEGIIRHIDQDKDALDPSGAHAACVRLPKKG